MIVRSVIRGMHVDSVTIYDSASNVISYSTDPKLVGKRNRGGIEYKRSLEGESSSLLITNGSLLQPAAQLPRSLLQGQDLYSFSP